MTLTIASLLISSSLCCGETDTDAVSDCIGDLLLSCHTKRRISYAAILTMLYADGTAESGFVLSGEEQPALERVTRVARSLSTSRVAGTHRLALCCPPRQQNGGAGSRNKAPG
jgi:hypothetical protein